MGLESLLRDIRLGFRILTANRTLSLIGIVWARTFTRFISITGWSPTTTAGFSRTMIYNGRAAAGMNCPLRVRARLRLGQNFAHRRREACRAHFRHSSHRLP